MSSEQKVIIIGAGLGGLVAAHACQSQNIPYEIFERDSSSNSRTQGWSISLHMAMESLRKYVTFPGAFDNFGEKVTVNREDPDSLSFSFTDGKTDEVYYHMKNSVPGSVYRIHRKRFRDWLISGLDQNKIHWNKKFSHYVSDQNSVTVYFHDATVVKGGILVAADGVLSGVCRQLVGSDKFDEITSINPVRTFAVDRWITKEEWEELKVISDCFGTVAGTDETSGSTSNMFWSINDTDLTRKDRKTVQIIWSISKYDPDQTIPHFESNEEYMRTLKGWAQTYFKKDGVFQRMVLNTPEDCPVYDFTIRERTPTLELMATEKRVFLIGDAAHCMTMYKGEGGNHAMLDSGNLGAQLGLYYKGEKTLDEIHSDYYTEMVARGAKAVAESHEAAINVHLHRDKMIAIFKGMQKNLNQ